VLVVGCSFSAIHKAVFAGIVDGQDYDLLARELGRLKRLVDGHRAQQHVSLDFAAADIDEISGATGRSFNIK